MCESVAGLCGSGWLHSQECLCHRVRHDRRCASLRLGYVKWVAAQPGVSVLQSQDIGHDRRCASLRLGYVKWVAAQPGVSVPQSQARIVDVRVCCWAMWEWVAAQPGVSVPQSQARIADVRVCCWAMWEWVAAQPGASVLQSQARSSMCESVAGLCGSGWLRSQECLCHRVKTSK